MPDVVPALLPLSLRPLPPSFLPVSLLPLLHLTLHHPICPYFPKLPHQTAGLMVSLGYSGKSPLLPVTLLTPSSKGPLCISTISSPLSAFSPKFLSLGPPQSLASYMEKLMVSPNSLHIPFTLPAPPPMESSFSFGYPQLALRARLVFPAAAFAHIPCKLQALVPGPRPQILFLLPVFHSHLGTFLGTQHPQTPVPKPFPVPTHISPLSSKPALALPAPPLQCTHSTTICGADYLPIRSWHHVLPQAIPRVPEKVWFPHGDCGATAPHPHPRSFLPTQDATAWSRLPSTVFPQVLSSLPVFPSRQASPWPAQSPRMQGSRPLSPC